MAPWHFLLLRRHPLLALARQVGNDADQAFDEEELRAVVHLVFLHAEDHLEAGLRSAGQLNAGAQVGVADALEALGEAFAVLLEGGDDLRLRRQRLGRRRVGTHPAAEVFHGHGGLLRIPAFWCLK